MLQVGDPLPHVELTTVTGDRFAYRQIWQRKNLVLVSLATDDERSARREEMRLLDHRSAFAAADTVVVVTRERVAGLPERGVIVADRWGEVAHVAVAPDAAGLPTPHELLEWIDYVQRRCPECEGETK